MIGSVPAYWSRLPYPQPANAGSASSVGRNRELSGDDIELREFILGDYLALYAIYAEAIHMLTLLHHRQSGYEFGAQTPPGQCRDRAALSVADAGACPARHPIRPHRAGDPGAR